MTSRSTGEPRILRCPHCGAPLDAAPFALAARCRYCGHDVKLAEPAAPRPYRPYSHPHAQPAAPVATASSRLVPLLIAGGMLGVLGVVAATVGFVAWRATAGPATRVVAQPIPAKAVPPPTAAPARPRAAEPTKLVKYPMSALLGIDTSVDIDGSRAHFLKLFPTIASDRVAGDLRYTVPLEHAWFGEAELRWKNERAGKLTTVGFRPPLGDAKLKNQKEISECLTRGLGKPQVREIDHLAGELSYFWGRHFPKAWANLYTGYLWMSFQDPRGVAPVTLAQVVRTLDGCAPKSP